MGASDDESSTVLGSKAVGEPPLLLGVGVLFAIRQALNAAKKDLGVDLSKWYNLGKKSPKYKMTRINSYYFSLDGPATVEKIQRASGIETEHFTL